MSTGSVTAIEDRAPLRGAIQRTAVLATLDATVGSRLVLIVGGPGYGKTTALSQWASANRTAWISVLPKDRGFGGMARAVLHALDEVRAGLELELLPVVASWSPQIGVHEAAGALVDLLNDALAREANPTSLIVDDASLLPQLDGSWNLLDALVRQSPAGLRVFISSRVQPPIPTQRLRASGGLTEIGIDILAFDQQEVAQLIRSLVSDVDDALVGHVFELTRGRPAAVRLIADALARVPAEQYESTVHVIAQSGRTLSGHLSEDALAAEAPDAVALLRSAAVLGGTEAIVAGAMGISDPDRRFADLARRGLLREEPPNSGRFVVAEALREVTNVTIEGKEAARVRRLAAAALESAGRPLDALTVHRAEPPSVSRTNAIRGLVLRRGRDMTESDGAAATAAVLLDIGVGGDPALETTLGEALQVSGDWDGAIQAYERAATGSDSLPARLTWRWGSLLYFRGELADAARVLERTAPGGDAGDHALVLAWTASVHWARGDVARASDAAEQALKRAEEAGVASAMAAAHVARALVAASTGDRDTNLREYERALAHAVEARETLLITRVEANLSSKYLEEADYAKAVEHAEAALRVGVGIPPLAALAESNRAEALLRLGRLEESMASIQRSRDMYTAAKSLNTQRPLTLLGDVCRERGDLAGARSAYLEARALAQRSGDAHALAPILAGLARLSAAEDPEEARRLADEASRRADARYRPMAAVTLGWVALTARDVVAARHFAAASEAAALDTRDQAGRAEALELAGACHPDSAEEHLSEAIAIWAAIKSPIGEARCRLARAVLQPKLWAAEESAARGTLVHLGVHMQPAAAGLLAVISEPDRGIRINTLGGFRVVRDGSVIRSAEWGSRKATTLLKLLLAHQGRPVSRAAIAEVIWPDADQRQMARRISELVSSLRTAFDPTRRHREDHYIISDARAVTLDIEHVELDVAELLASAREGLRAVDEHDWTQALAQLERAESLCGGEFLEEDAYEPWTAECREQVRVAATNVSRALAQLAEQRSNNESACRHLRRVLERDPHDEEAWLLLIAALVRMRRHGEARRAYATYTTRMREIGVAPAPFDRYGESTAKSVHSPGTPRN